jgi:hypothetical protein
VRWVEVVEAVVVVVAVAAVAVAAGRAAWAAPSPPGQVATASAPVVGTASRTWWACLVIRRSAPSAARRWSARRESVKTIPSSLWLPLRRLRVALAIGRFSVGKGACGLKAMPNLRKGAVA